MSMHEIQFCMWGLLVMENHCVTFRVNDALTSLITLGSIPTAVQHFYIFECCIDKIKVFFFSFFHFQNLSAHHLQYTSFIIVHLTHPSYYAYSTAAQGTNFGCKGPLTQIWMGVLRSCCGAPDAKVLLLIISLAAWMSKNTTELNIIFRVYQLSLTLYSSVYQHLVLSVDAAVAVGSSRKNTNRSMAKARSVAE